MEMNGGSIVLYLACTPCVLFALLVLIGLETKGFFGRELSEFLSAYCLCGKANSLSFSQNAPSLAQNSALSLSLEQYFKVF